MLPNMSVWRISKLKIGSQNNKSVLGKRDIANFILLFLLIFFISNLSFAQSLSISIKDASTNKAEMYALIGEKTFFLDSGKANSAGGFQFITKKEKYHTGLYRLSFGNNKWIDFINDGEEITIVTDYKNIFDSLKVITSESN